MTHPMEATDDAEPHARTGLADLAEPPRKRCKAVLQAIKRSPTTSTEGAERPAGSGTKCVAASACESSEAGAQRPEAIDDPDPVQHPNVAVLVDRHRKRRAQERADEALEPQLRPAVKDRCPIAQLFAACRCNPLEAGGASPDSAVQPAAVQQQREKMPELLQALKMLLRDVWVADGAKGELKTMTSQASDLQGIPVSRDVLTKPSIRALYTSMCPPLSATQVKEQDPTHASLTACCSLQRNVIQIIQFVHAREEIGEARMQGNGCPWDPYGYPVCLHNLRSRFF